jgi:hypothetical protein
VDIRRTPVDAVGLTSGVQAIAAGEAHTCALTNQGGVKCWGRNQDGQLGHGTIVDTPMDVVGLASGVQAIATGGQYSCALTKEDAVKCWGDMIVGGLGDGTVERRLTPVDVLGLAGGVKALAAGVYHSCVLTTTGDVKCWGSKRFGELGPGAVGFNFAAIPLDVPLFDTPDAPDTPDTPSGIGSVTIPPGASGSVVSENGQISITFPVQTQALTVTVAGLTDPPVLGDSTLIGQGFTVNASGEDGSPVTNFAQPFTLVVTYADADWQTGGVALETELNLYFWNGEQWRAILPCANCSHDVVSNRITVVLDHLTQFALLANGRSQLYVPLVTHAEH